MKNNFKVIIGVVLLIIGSALLIDRMGFVLPFTIDLREIFTVLWPLLIIAFGIKLFIDRNITWAIIVSTLGLVILFTTLFDFNFFSILWPLIIIGIGLSILLRKDGHQFSSSTETTTDDYITESFSFSDSKRKIKSYSFKGGNFSLSFGELEIDLSEVKVDEKGAELNLSASFGEIQVIVPQNCRVITDGSSFLGSWEPNLKSSSVKKPVLKITGNVFLAEVEITN